MPESNLRIGIMGGTFDPIHIGHLVIAQEAWYKLHLDKVVFVPAGMPPHKPNEPVIDPEHRFNMTGLAIDGNPAFEISRMEIERSGPSYTVDTLKHLKQVYGEDCEIYFIIGADSLLDIMGWHKPQRIAEMCTLVAAARPGYDTSAAELELPKEIMDKVILLEVPEVGISSTEIRSRVPSGIPIRYLVPCEVEKYIVENSLYKAGK